MEKPKRPYCLFKRPTVRRNTCIYYCRFRDENGNYMSPISTLQFSKAAARNWADQKLKEGKIVLPGKRGTPFKTFASGFWDYPLGLASCAMDSGVFQGPAFARDDSPGGSPQPDNRPGLRARHVTRPAAPLPEDRLVYHLLAPPLPEHPSASCPRARSAHATCD